MPFYRDIWKSSTRPLPDKAVAVGDTLLVINSADMLEQLKFPIKLTYSILSIVCFKGWIEFEIDTQRVRLEPNTLLVLKPGQTLSSASSSIDFDGFSIVGAIKALNSLFPYMSKVVMCFMQMNSLHIIKLSEEEAESQRLYNKLLRRKIMRGRKGYNDLVIKSLGEAVFYETLGLYASHLAQTSLVKHRRSEEIFYEFLTLVENNYRKERSVGFYADRINVTSKHLSAVIKECSGRTASEWIDNYVINEARILLSSTDKTIQQISSELNFPNQSFFGKYFKHHTGFSPRQYRNDSSRP